MEEGPLVASGVISSPLSISCLANWICLYLLPSPSSKRRKGCGAIFEKHRTFLIVLVGEKPEMDSLNGAVLLPFFRLVRRE